MSASTTYCLHCGRPIVWDHDLWLHTETNFSDCTHGARAYKYAEPAPDRHLSGNELSAAYWHAAFLLALIKKPSEKVLEARKLLTLQRFRDHPHYDQEHPEPDDVVTTALAATDEPKGAT